jgi:hypothetical protein
MKHGRLKRTVHFVFFRADVCLSTSRNGNENVKEGKRKVIIDPNNDIGEKRLFNTLTPEFNRDNGNHNIPNKRN